MRLVVAHLSVALLVCGLAVSPAYAAPKTDVIVLRNGDRLTCEIKSLGRGRLEVSTDDAGTLDIEWDKVTRVTSTRIFEVESAQGDIHVGVIASPSDAQLTVTDTAGGTTTHDFMIVIRLSPIGRSFFRRLDGAFNLGFSFTESSGVAQLTVTGNTTYRRPAFEVSASISSYVTRQRDADDTDRQNFQFGYAKQLRHRWVIGGLGILDRNPELGFEFRETAALIVGRRVLQSNRGDVSFGGGLAVSEEQPLDGESSTNTDAVLTATGSFYTYDSPKTNLSYSVLVYPGLSETGRIRTEVNLAVSREVFKDFTVGTSGYDSYDNRPPTGSSSSHDFGVTLTIGWTF